MSHRMTPFPQHGLYAITRDAFASPEMGLEAVSQALKGGAAVVQYRAKPVADEALACALLTLCRSAGVPLIINDDVELAARIGADGVHLGRDDMSLSAARRRLGDDVILGVSCYDALERAEAAQAEGASYVAFGRFFPSTSKPLASLAHLDTLRQAHERLHLPIVAIGGINAGNAAGLLAAGADLLAVIEGVFGQDDPEQAARQLAGLFDLGKTARP